MLEHIQKIVQQMPNDIEVLLANVISTNPLRLSIVGNPKRQPSGNSIIVPKHLRNYTLSGTSESGGSVQVNVNDALVTGDLVACIGFDRGNKYLITDKVVS